MKVIEKQAKITLCEEPLPIQYDDFPAFTKEDYQERIEHLWKMEQAQNYDFIIIYGDREHFSNVDYFTGYDVRWEETLLILHSPKDVFRESLIENMEVMVRISLDLLEQLKIIEK